MAKKSNTVQLGLRIDAELLAKIELMAKHESIEKMDWIRRALKTFLEGEETAASDEAIEDYIAARIDENTLLKYLHLKDVPSDIKKAREEYIGNLKQEIINERNR
jgi:hypothetical protein